MSSPTPPGYGPPQGYLGYGPPPKRSNTGLIVGIVIVFVLVLLVFAGLLMLITRSDGESPTEPQAQPSQARPTPAAPSQGQPSESVPKAPTAPRLAEATAMATKFVGYLNANKQKEAAALGCEGSKRILPGAILLMVDESTDLKVSGKVRVEEPGTTAYPMRMDLVPISGTARYEQVSGFVRLEDVPDQPICVRLYELK